MQDRPTAIELLRAAQEFCENDLMPALTGRVGFHARVLLNVLRILERELAGEEEALHSEWERLAGLLDSSDEPPPTFAELAEEVRGRNMELARRIRDGELDDRLDEVARVLRETISEKLQIANPRYV